MVVVVGRKGSTAPLWFTDNSFMDRVGQSSLERHVQRPGANWITSFTHPPSPIHGTALNRSGR